jgi:hypothetical protein
MAPGFTVKSLERETKKPPLKVGFVNTRISRQGWPLQKKFKQVKKFMPFLVAQNKFHCSNVYKPPLMLQNSGPRIPRRYVLQNYILIR